MSQLALTFAQRAATTLAQGFASRAISSLLAKRRDTGARLEELHVLSSTDGAPMPIPFGRVRLGGQVIWVDQPVEHTTNSRAGGKGGPRIRERSYTLSLAIGLCEGQIDGIGRIWADGAVFNAKLSSMRVYDGAVTQLPDPLIETTEGSAATPAFRGLAYVVFEDLSIEEFGNRIPQFSFEVFRSANAGGAENVEEKIKGVSLIPGSGEFVYATEPVITDLGPGRSRSENEHSFRGKTDVEVSLDDLQTHLPNCKTVSLVVSWFGDDLRCENNLLQPKIEVNEKATLPLPWRVQGLNRTQVPVVSLDDKQRPLFGGTPSDDTVLQTIASLKVRGMDVVFYPFILMDIPPGNLRPDPYGGTEQSAFPWRGRITSFPAPLQPNTVDQTDNVIGQIDLFFGTALPSDFTASNNAVTYSGPNEWSYRRFILHYAHLCALAGGVDAFIIGSELRAMTMLRDSSGNFPTVSHLRQLAADVRAILPGAKISYAADWSEYFGYQPQDGSNDVLYNLDPLWADPNVDFVGIDWYAPLSDWREGNLHIDAGAFRSIYEGAYLATNVEGGEGYDWFYASFADRQNQLRTPITDGAYNKDWVFRYKDIRSWWSNPHFDRPSGIEAAMPTAWVPQSKPIWFTETGCPAVDKGSNQPNVFFDAKSSESAFPYFSRGRRDDFIQRMYLDAITTYWAPQSENNPSSSVYGGPMLEDQKILAWTWDARPFPQFPALDDVWSDGANWEKGHWLNGRMGLSSLAALIQDLCWRADIFNIDVSQVEGLVPGYVVSGPTDARSALETLITIYDVGIFETFDGLRFQTMNQQGQISIIAPDQFVLDDDNQAPTKVVPDRETLPVDVRIQFSDEGADYQPASASVHGIETQKSRTISLALPLVTDSAFVRDVSHDLLAREIASMHTAGVVLPPSFLALEPGDLIRVDSLDIDQVWRVKGIDDAGTRELSLQAQSPASIFARSGAEPGLGLGPLSNPGPPEIVVMDLPLLVGEDDRKGPRIAAFAEPWDGDVTIQDGNTLIERLRMTAPATIGEVIVGINSGGILGRWDYGTELTVQLYGGALASFSQELVLGGENVMAVEHDNGAWEVLQFQNAVLAAADTYVLSGLLRGLAGSDDALPSPISQKAKCVLLNGASQVLPMRDFEIGTPIEFLARSRAAEPGSLGETTVNVIFSNRVSRQSSPVHLRADPGSGGVVISWIRRARRGGDYWGVGDVPLETVPEAYQFRVYIAGVVLSETVVTEPKILLSDMQIDGLFPSGRPLILDIGVSQISPFNGLGVEARQILYI